MCTGQWKNPEDSSRDKDQLEYYLWLAKLAERGSITGIFFADNYGTMQTYGGTPDALFKGGSMVGYLDPVTIVSAMAAVTKSVGFGITGSTSYIRMIIQIFSNVYIGSANRGSSVRPGTNLGKFGSHYAR